MAGTMITAVRPNATQNAKPVSSRNGRHHHRTEAHTADEQGHTEPDVLGVGADVREREGLEKPGRTRTEETAIPRMLGTMRSRLLRMC